MKRLLIANRGEISNRIARTARQAGLTAIGIYPDDDANSLHVIRMDETVRIPGNGARAYLDTETILSAARHAEVDAIHPGYGFLSESAEFAAAVEQEFTFVGPTVYQLSLFGDKPRARATANAVGVPVLDGLSSPLSLEDARAFFHDLPDDQAIILKAAAGGGGRGVRIVRSEDDLAEAFERAQSEAMAAFGDERLYAETYLEQARHIEVQIIGDGQGGVSHLWDRDCTLQRRHQKMIEIAPSPFLSSAMRETLCDAAVEIASSVNFRGVGTIEFLTNESGTQYWFIEGNARLQVEHTITEEILGLDLVRQQLSIAEGASLSQLNLQQGNIPQPNGTAIQARICTETLHANGTIEPGVGALERFATPEGVGVRVDHNAYEGATISPAYDSLLAKLIVRNEHSFEATLDQTAEALDRFIITGVPTNIPTLSKLCRNPSVRQGGIHTRFVDEHIEELASPEKSTPEKSVPLPSRGQPADAMPSPMAGVLVEYSVAPGDTVWAGKTVAIVEAMKMEHEVKAVSSGVVRRLTCEPGDLLSPTTLLLEFDPQDVEVVQDNTEGEKDLDAIRPDLQRALDRLAAGYDENRPDAVAKRHGRGHRTARENIEDLCDPGTFFEYGGLTLAAQRRRRSLEDLIANTTGDGMVCGLGHVNGALFGEDRSRIVAMTYDYMVLAGTQGALNHYKKDRMFEVAKTQRLPVIVYTEGGGGRPGDTDPMGVAGLDCLAFNYFAKLSGLVPTIGIVNGRCFAGNAILLGCCDVIIATKSSNIGVGGPAMIEGGGLGVFSPEEIGPVEDQVPSGVVDILVDDEAEATDIAKKYLSYFQGPITDWDAPDERDLRFIVPEARKRAYDMREVIAKIADLESVLELRPDFGVGIHTTLIRVEGRPLGVLANNPNHLSGAIDAPGADKAARFLQLCDAFDLPVISLVDCPGIMVGPEIEKTGLVRHASRVMVAGANMTTPMMSFIIRKGYGLGAQAMTGGSFKAPLFCVSWPTGEFGGMGLEGAVKLGYRKELEAIEDPDERQKTYDDMVAQMYERGSAINMASHFEIDNVIDPATTRAWIMSGLKSLPPTPVRTQKKHPFIDTY